MNDIQFDTIEEAIVDFKEGKFLIVVDDADRENEGDLIIPAEKITPDKVNFMEQMLCISVRLNLVPGRRQAIRSKILHV